MRILIHGINYSPELIGIGKYTGEMAEWLANKGHEVSVVTAPPYYPAWRVEKGYSSWKYQRELLERVDVWRCPLWVPSKPTGLKRLLHLASFAISSFPVMIQQIFWRPDIVITVEPPLFSAPQAWLTARLARAKAWLHIQDFEVEAFFGLGFAPSRFFKKFIMALETWIMRRFDCVSSISKSMTARIAQLGVQPENIVLFPNWVDTKHICPNLKGRNFRQEWGFSESQKIVLYSGNLGKKQGIEIIVDVAEQIRTTNPEAIFLIVGEGAAKKELIERAVKQGVNNIVFKPLQPIEDLPSLLAMADLHLVIQKRGAADAVMPSKLTGILAAGGTAIITADPETELGRLVKDNPGIAMLVNPEDPEALIQAVLNFLVPSAALRRINPKARAYAEQYLEKNVVMYNFERKLLQLCGKKV